jgi:hypothetical protein
MSVSDQELDRLLGDLRDEDLPDAAVAAVRARVLAAVATPRRSAWRWAWAPALAAAVLLALLIPRPAGIAPPPSMARAPQAPPLVEVRAVAPERPRLARTKLAVVHTEFIKIMTDDPDVVILWALNGTESKGGLE